MVVRSSGVACPQIFPDGLTVYWSDKAGHCLIFFIVIISLSDWPSSLVSGSSSTSNSESEMLSVDLISVISATPSSPDLQFSLHGTSKFHWKFCFAQGLGEKGERTVKGIQCVMFALCEPSLLLRLITCVGLPPPTSHTQLQTVDAQNLLPKSGLALPASSQ